MQLINVNTPKSSTPVSKPSASGLGGGGVGGGGGGSPSPAGEEVSQPGTYCLTWSPVYLRWLD